MQMQKKTGAQDAAALARMDELSEKLKQAYDTLEDFQHSNPTESISELKKAHAALLEYAKSKKTPKDVAEMTTAIEEFARAADRTAKAVNALKHS